MEDQCKTKYPVVLIHGFGFRDSKHLNYWGRIPKTLMKYGASVHHGNQDGYGSVETNAAQIRENIENILKETGADKVNLIAHSKGGMDARYMAAMPEMRGKVASLTTICTPHHGSKTMDIILKFPKFMIKIVAFFTNIWYRMLGDKKPDSMTVFHQLSTAYALDFNKNVMDDPAVYCQSFAFVMNNMFSDILMWLPYCVISIVEGKNDGLVTPASAEWANFRGIVTGVSNRGISHCDEVDLRRQRFTKKEAPDKIGDIADFYINVVAELKERGY